MGARKKKGRKQKNRAYYMRFTPKLRRRREAKTDYQARTVLIRQDKNKYNTPKYRFAVRISNKDVLCQVISAKMIGDEVMCAAYAHELPRYGLTVGLTNFAACYCTGLLLARRLLKQLSMEDYEGIKEATGEYFIEEADYDEDDPNEPFTANLDVGLRRTTTGSRVFAAMKGATDGGLLIPHRDNGKQFPGYYKEDGQDVFTSETCLKYIYAGHVGDYMKKLEDENPDKYQSHFSKYIAAKVGADDLEDLYKGVHAKIRADANPSPKKSCDKYKGDKAIVSSFKSRPKKTRGERRDHVLNKILALRAKAKQA